MKRLAESTQTILVTNAVKAAKPTAWEVSRNLPIDPARLG